MVKNWDIYSRQGLDFASSAASLGFSVAKSSTKLGFAVTRGITSTAVGLTTTIVDHAFFGGLTVTRPVIGGAVSSLLSVVEKLTLAPIYLGEYITSTSVIAAHSSINVLAAIFPGSSTHEASFSLVSFIDLVKREWADSNDSSLPEKQYGVTEIAHAVVAWAALQGVTREWEEERWFKNLKEIDVKDPPKRFDSIRNRQSSRIRVTSDVIFPGHLGQLVVADIGEAPAPVSKTGHSTFLHPTLPTSAKIPSTSALRSHPHSHSPNQLSSTQLKLELRRLSKIVLAGYGGASLLFFGVPIFTPSSFSASTSSPTVQSNTKTKAFEEAQLANAINASEAEAQGDREESQAKPEGNSRYPGEFSWWDILLGKHDREIFAHFARGGENLNGKKEADIKIGAEHLIPRYWVLTDHERRQVVLVLRGTMSLNEIAVDLTCELEGFEPALSSSSSPHSTSSTAAYEEELETPIPGQYSAHLHEHKQNSFAFPRARQPSSASIASTASGFPQKHYVHGGMLRMARAMGGTGKPVHVAVREALERNKGYGLVLCGHSLGAGVAALLGLMWADPKTCLTVNASGLPVDRKVSVYCFAPPALTSSSLSSLSQNLITSFVYSHDVVSRLSLGTVRDLKNAASWLCEAQSQSGGKGGDAGYSQVIARASRWKAGRGSEDDINWFIAVRKTLEANMRMSITSNANTKTYPPGRVFWALRESDLCPSHRSQSSPDSDKNDKLRLFQVLDVPEVFDGIVFAKDMLSAHLPHKYDSVLHDLI